MTPQELAARTAWGEARGEGVVGMHAILNVIAHRVARPGWWGRDVESVCASPWQFSCWNETDPNCAKAEAVTDEDPLFRSALSLAQQMAAGTLVDVTNGADSYFALGIPLPRWAAGRKPVKVIGHHAFYRLGLTGDGE
ncbi:cell wall hydrolase [Gluconobacter sp. R75690]|uniref:cell wall hydrolase n=1 Tax=Gluconobacter TaxID=441 RepID=UPI00188ADC63|nr:MULTISPECIES: cell wall hydrolase [unclassified Gluconobacter]MBF0850429.1 cell wall hydrolase [Gluconobacter sp. R75690]MBF0879121.1 cell wall hydrolase [Gluconobacter sp. R75828]